VTNQVLSDPKTPIGEILKAAGSEGIVLEYENQAPFAVIPLDDDVIDLLIERNPRFRAICREIRAQMDGGQFQTHQDIRKRLDALDD
jgi:hypothetical protein